MRYTVRRKAIGDRPAFTITTRDYPSFSQAVDDAVEFVTMNLRAWQATVVDEDAIVLADLKSVRR